MYIALSNVKYFTNSIAYGGFIGQNAGEIVNSMAISDVGTGNGNELVAACAFDEIKWDYIENLFSSSYNI